MKRILYVATNDFNKFGGGPQAVRAFLDSTLDIFGKDNVDVLLGTECQLLEEYKDINCIRIPKRSRILCIYELVKGYIERWTTPVKSHLKHHSRDYDLVIFNSSKSGAIVKYIQRLGLKVVTIHHNDELEYCIDNRNIYTLGGRYSGFVNKAQQKSYLYSDINLFLTEQDKYKFEKQYGPNGKCNAVLGVYDFKSAKIVVPTQLEYEYHIGASGSLMDYQTLHGIIDIKNHYLDIIKKLIPDYKLLLTGRNPSQQVLDFAEANSDHVHVVPNPTDIISIIEKSLIYLCPTDIGGGIKLRVMDGLKLGMPILVHKVSARGYDSFFDKPYFMIYDNRTTFECGLTDLLSYVAESNMNVRNRISADYYSIFGYEAGTSRFKKLLDGLL